MPMSLISLHLIMYAVYQLTSQQEKDHNTMKYFEWERSHSHNFIVVCFNCSTLLLVIILIDRLFKKVSFVYVYFEAESHYVA
jgi:arginyl-tRNA--protein-N-Asp/Glu arginylyltransferase